MLFYFVAAGVWWVSISLLQSVKIPPFCTSTFVHDQWKLHTAGTLQLVTLENWIWASNKKANASVPLGFLIVADAFPMEIDNHQAMFGRYNWTFGE